MANGKKGDQQRIAAQERRIQALAYRKAGASYRAIADTLAVSLAQAHDDVQAALAELAAEQRAEASDLRALEAARLDSLQAAVWQQALHGNLKAIQTVLRIMERRARLVGLDMQPERRHRQCGGRCRCCCSLAAGCNRRHECDYGRRRCWAVRLQTNPAIAASATAGLCACKQTLQ